MAITYCVVCNITGEKYYGSTIKTLKHRMIKHKSELSCRTKQIIERGDYNSYILGEYETEEQARLKEKWYINNKECINRQRINCTSEELLEQKRNYYHNNKEQNKQKRIEYREKNKETIKLKKAEKVQCEFCNEYSTSSHLRRHQRSKKCLKFQ